jgi:hypothetical protein
LRSIGNSLYFCVPRNDKLLGYWDTVADRRFKIRNSLNLRGIFRQLALFEPPIDPALLAKAAAAGLDVAAIVARLSQPLPLVRFRFLMQKATEICQEVKSLGAHLLAAMEKEDSERLAILRAEHELDILRTAERVRYGQWQEAIKAREGIEQSLANATARYTHYERLLAKSAQEITVPELEPLDPAELDALELKTEEPEVGLREIEIDIAPDPTDEGGGRKLSSEEVAELEKLRQATADLSRASKSDDLGASLGMIPNFSGELEPLGTGTSMSFGGSNLAAVANLTSGIFRSKAQKHTDSATKSSKLGSYDRRKENWQFDSNVAAGEISALFKQLRAAQIREAIAEREFKNHQEQIAHAKEIEDFLIEEKQGKQTNQAFYVWMKREVKGLCARCYELAFEVAKQAERALQHELRDPQ